MNSQTVERILILTGVAILCLAIPVSSSYANNATTPAYSTKFAFWFGIGNDAPLKAFLQSRHPGVTYINPSQAPDSLDSTVTSKGYQLSMGLGGYAAKWAQGYAASDNVIGYPTCPSCVTDIAGFIDLLAKSQASGGAGVKMIYVDEPDPAPGESSETSPTSIAFNVTGFNLIYNYIHNNYPGVQFGLTKGNCSYCSAISMHLAYLQAGLNEDFAMIESYEADGASIGTTSDFVTSGIAAQFPKVKTAVLVYNTIGLCSANGNNYIKPGMVDYIGFWNVDNYGGWIGPWMDAVWMQNAETFAATGNKPFCDLPYSFVWSSQWTWDAKTTNFTVNITDNYYVTPPALANQIASCDYMVMSGVNAINGPTDPSVSTTLNWTPRMCNGTITITVGAGMNCKDIGTKTCLVFTRAHTNSGATGNFSYQEYSISY
jgi:hypothetical protein